jgi:uncharacterized membrane protein
MQREPGHCHAVPFGRLYEAIKRGIRVNSVAASGTDRALCRPRVPLLPPDTGQFSRVLARNIDGLIAARRADERRKSGQERISDTITRFTGSLRFVYIHALLFGAWIISNLGWIPGLPAFDPSFVVLAMTASVEAIFLSTFVLISQNRMQAQAEKRAELDLQISLLAEHEITALMKLLDAVAQHLGVEQPNEQDIAETKQDVDPRAVLRAIEHGSGGPAPS